MNRHNSYVGKVALSLLYLGKVGTTRNGIHKDLVGIWQLKIMEQTSKTALNVGKTEEKEIKLDV